MRILAVLLMLVTFGCFAEGTLPSNKSITSFSFRTAQNPGLAADATATVSGSTITVDVPHGTDVTHLVATFAAQADHVLVGSVTQTSGVTANNFTSPVTYDAVAADGTKQSFTVTVNVGAASAKDLTTFSFRAADNPSLTSDVTATINGTTIMATLPFGTNVTALKATFTTTGTTVRVGSTTQVSGTTANNFTSPVTYTVAGADGSTKDYTVTVTLAPSSAKDITAFSFTMAANPSLPSDVTATITGTTITATVPFGTNVTALKATFTTTGASVKVGTTTQVSGTTANDFTNDVTYTVTAADNTTTSYTVTVSIADGSSKDITAFSFLMANNPNLPTDVTATITGTAITAAVPAGTDLTGLVATFTTTGASVSVGTMVQTSGTTPNDFTLPVTYTVTALDNTTQDYTVTVTAAAVACDALTNPAHGTVAVSNSGNFPSTATYACDLSYALNGSDMRTCAADGTWSGAAPTCDPTIMITRVGTGTAALSSAATAVFVEIYRATDGMQVGSRIAMPTADNGTQYALTMSGTATSEGILTLSSDRRFVMLGGYNAVPGTASVTSSASMTINRVVGRIDANLAVDTSTRLNNVLSGANIRAVCTKDGTDLWAVGSSGGVFYSTFGATSGTAIASPPSNIRACSTAGDQLYVSSASSPFVGVSTVGAGLPTTAGQAATLAAASGSPQGFAIVDSDGTGGVDTMYIAVTSLPGAGTNAVNVEKWTFANNTWTKQTFTPTLSGANIGTYAVTAWVDGSTVHVTAVTTDYRVVAFDDTGATPAVTVLVPAVAMTAVRGVSRSPDVAP
jgi:hypothetical protein